MKTQNLNLFIVDDNRLMTKNLKRYLNIYFGKELSISTFKDGESCLKEFDKNVDLVVLDYALDEESKNKKNGLDVLKTIKERNPSTKVVMLSSSEEMKIVAQSLKYGAIDYILKERNSWNKVRTFVSSTMVQGVKRFVPEFSLKQYALLFILAFVSIGVIVALMLKLFP